MTVRVKVASPVNPYRDNVQGKANEPITVAALLDRARKILGYRADQVRCDWTLEEIYDRLEENAPRIAIIGGSADHPAHIVDPETVARAALRIWENGGVPFYFSTPVLCDGTAQSTQGMSYSLASRNAIAEIVVNQMEAHSYHGAFVIQGCDKQPLAVVCALAHLDRVRRRRGEAPVFAVFAPAHVLKGGTIPEPVRAELEAIARQAEAAGWPNIAEDLRDTMAFILQCSSNTAFQGVLTRAVEAGLITTEKHKELERALAVNTCDAKGGICAFNGTGNSSRHLVAGLGLVHPALELLTEPPTQEQVNRAVDDLFRLINRPECGVAELIGANIANAVRIHSASGGSTNLMMHLVAAMIYAGYRFDLFDLEAIHRAHPVPDLFDYSLTQGRDIFVLAQQCCAGMIRGMETLVYELVRNGVPMDLDAMTVTGTTWRERLRDTKGLAAEGVKENPIILSRPRRSFSGVDVLRGNFFESAVVKISGMSTPQLDEFDEKVALVLYFENEELANETLLDIHLLDRLREKRVFPEEDLIAVWRANAPDDADEDPNLSYDARFSRMVEQGALKLAIVIAGQGPEAFGMPEMFTPMQHINANRTLRKLATVISDGRYSGVTYGAAIGHVTPEAFRGGGILYLQTGDVLHLRLRKRQILLLDPEALRRGERQPWNLDLARHRAALGEERLARMRERRRRIAAANRIVSCTDAARGVVPLTVYEEAELSCPAVLRHSRPSGKETGVCRE